MIHSYNTSKLARTLFPVKSTNSIKIKITHHRVLRDGAFERGNIKFLILSVMAYLKKDVLWRNDISFKKDTEKVVLLLVKKGLIQIIVKFKGENSLITFLSCPKRTFEGKWCEKWCMKYCARKGWSSFENERPISGTRLGS